MRFYLVSRVVILGAALTMLASAARADAVTPIEKTYTYPVHLLGKTEQDSVILKISGASLSAPFKWSMMVKNPAGLVVFSVERDDTWLDKFFGDDGYVIGCKGYAECKRSWYFEQLPAKVQSSASISKAGSHDFDESTNSVLQVVANNFLKDKGLAEERRTAVIKEMQTLLTKGGAGLLCPPNTPVEDDSCYVYVPSLGYFVPFFSD